MVKPAGYVIPVSVPPNSGASTAENPVAIVESVTKETAQYSPAGGDCAVPEMIWHPASPKDCLSVLLVIGVVYRIQGSGSMANGSGGAT